MIAKDWYLLLQMLMLVMGIMLVLNMLVTTLCIRCTMRRQQHLEREPAGPAPSRTAEDQVETGLRRRQAAPVVCFYVQGGKKLHTGRNCCGMGSPQQLHLPAAAVPYTAWCRHCSADLIPK